METINDKNIVDKIINSFYYCQIQQKQIQNEGGSLAHLVSQTFHDLAIQVQILAVRKDLSSFSLLSG